MLETYITPLLMSYVDKYIKNLKPSDLSLSIWGGDVVLYNLELNLDVIEKELQLPITFLSGRIHKLQIHVPWTKLGSEAVKITINTLECVVQLRDPAYKPDHPDTTTSLAAFRAEAKEACEEKHLQDRGDPPPPGYVQSLVNRVANNISVCIHNVILKYVEDDIVLSLNIKSADVFSVNEKWERAFVDITAPDYVLHRVCSISDLTVCLDKKNTSGTIDMYQDPLLYRCGLACRIKILYDPHFRPKKTVFNVYCESLDVTITDQQLPLSIRLIKLCMALYYGTLDLPGCNYKSHPAAEMVMQKKGDSQRRTSNVSLNSNPNNESTNVPTGPQDDWLNWVWSFVPDTTEDEAKETRSIPPDALVLFGFYISQVTFTLKLTEKVSEGSFFGGQRFQFKPFLSFELSGVTVEVIIKGEEFFDAQVGVTSVMGWTHGECVCKLRDEFAVRANSDLEEVDEKEELILTIKGPPDSASEPSGFLVGSLFHASDQTFLVLPELVLDMDKFIQLNSESYALRRYGAFFFDYLYTMEIEPERDMSIIGEDEEDGDIGKIRLVKEFSHKRILCGPTHLQCTANFVHRLELIHQLSDDGTPARKEKSELFYDDFIEKQLLAGNIPSRQFSIALISVTVCIPGADHWRDSSSYSGQGLHSAGSLHSIHEQSGKNHQQIACVLHVERLELETTTPMYPTELAKLTMANAGLPAGKNMMHHAYNNTVIKVLGAELGLSQITSDSLDQPVINIMPSVSLIASYHDCILPESWEHEGLTRNEVQLELPSLTVGFTKPEFILMANIMTSWIVTLSGSLNESPDKWNKVPQGLLDVVFEPESPALTKLEVFVDNTELQYCDTAAVMSVSGSVGSLHVSIQPIAKSRESRTPLLQGPIDTSLVYTGNMFRGFEGYQVDPVEAIGPVMSLTMQVLQTPNDGDSTPASYTSNVMLLHIKGVAICLDPMLYAWLGYSPPSTPSSSCSNARDRDTRAQRHQTLRRTSSIGTPRKKSFARGHSSVASPIRDKKTRRERSGTRPSPGERTGESSVKTGESRTFEAWLYDKLSIITSFSLQVDIRSVIAFAPEASLPYLSGTHTITHNLYNLAHNGKNNLLPTTLVTCLPCVQLHSAGHTYIPVRQKLPLHLPREPGKDGSSTLPWTLKADNLAVYSVHRSSSGLPVVHSVLAPVGSTAVLASAKSSSGTYSLGHPHPPLAGLHGARTSRPEDHRFPTLGFCVHTDFTPVVVECSRKQIVLLSNLLEPLLYTIVSQLPVGDVTSAPSMPSAPAKVLTRTLSQASSSALDQADQESLHSGSESSASYTQVPAQARDVKVSLWLQWTLPRCVAHLYGMSAHSPTCVTADLEDLTAFIDYQETQLQMQYKVGAFNVTHSQQRDGSWSPGPFSGIVFSCKDILSRKSPFNASSRISTSGLNPENSPHGPHGFLTVNYKRSSLHLKRQRSVNEGSGTERVTESCCKQQHEVRVSVQPFDVVLYIPAIIAAVDIFDLSVWDKFGFLSRQDSGVAAKNYEHLKSQSNRDPDDGTTYSANLLPLLFINMRDLRIFLPTSPGPPATDHTHQPPAPSHMDDHTHPTSVPSHMDGYTQTPDVPSHMDGYTQTPDIPSHMDDHTQTPDIPSHMDDHTQTPDIPSHMDDHTQTSDVPTYRDDLVVVHLSSINSSPHPDNPNSRLVLHRDLHERFRRFGRSSRHALGYDLHEVQYQVEVTGLGVWSGRWEELCGKLCAEGERKATGGSLMEQNPALEWNTQLWRSTQEVYISPLVSAFDLRFILAPAVSMDITVATDTGQQLCESVPVCGWALECNVTTDVECFLRKSQIQLLQALVWSNIQVISSCSLMKTVTSTGKLIPSEPHSQNSGKVIQHDEKPDSGMRPDSGFRPDSGIGSGLVHTTKKKDESVLIQGLRKFPGNADGFMENDKIPWEVFVAARRLTIRAYHQGTRTRRPSLRSSSLLTKSDAPGRMVTSLIRPVFQLEMVHPAVTLNTQAREPHVRLLCYDAGLKGAVNKQGWISRDLPESSDYPVDWFVTRLGDPDPLGVLPSLLTINIKRTSTGAADICVDLGRPAIVSINLGIIDALSQFMSGLIIPSSHQPSPSPPRPGTANPVSRLASMSNISLTTREVTLEVSAVSHPDEPSITVSAASARIGTQFRDSLRKVDANVTVEGLLMSCMLQQKCFYLIKPFAFDGDLEMTFSPHSLSDAFPSLPQVCTRLNIALVQVDIGQEHVRCLSLLSDLIQQHVNDDPSSMEGKTDISESKTYTMEDEFESKEGNTDIKERSTAAKEKDTETKGSEAVSMVSDPDYKRNDTFTLGSVLKNNESQRDTKGKESDTKGNKTGAKGREAVIKNRDKYINGTETDTKENEWRTVPGMDANDIGTYVRYCPNGRKIGGSEDRVRRQQRAGDSARRSFDDLRTGPFTYLSEQGNPSKHPEPFEIMFTSDSRDRPPTMVWRYREPRALSAVEVLPLPFTSPVLVNTLNMGDEVQVPCVLSYWDNLQKSYIIYKEFYISESRACHIALPDPLTADPATVVIAEEWQMIVDASVDIDYPDDNSVGAETGSAYSSPYRGLISPTSLAASAKVNSVFTSALIPAVSAQISIGVLELKLVNHTNTEKQDLPSYLDDYKLYPPLPPEQEFLLLTVEGLSGVSKHLGGVGAVTLAQFEWNCHCDLIDFGDLTYRRFLSPCDVRSTSALYHGNLKCPSFCADVQSERRSLWLESGVEISSALVHVSQSTVHTAALAAEAWGQEKEVSLFSHYVICNETQQALRLGQVDTDESLILPSRHALAYCWRSPRSARLEPRLHVCIEAEGNWRWSEPFDIDGVGVCARTIHHRLHSATLFIDVRLLSGVQKQVIIRGTLQISSKLSINVDLQILRHPSLTDSINSKPTQQVCDSFSLTPHTTLPSYVVSHAGLAGMRVRIPNCTTWSEILPLDQMERDGRSKSQHLVVQLLGVKDFETYCMWYHVTMTPYEQLQITLSPLFVMRSHLPEPVLMNVLTVNTSVTSSLPVTGQGKEQEILNLPPNCWHHLTFQFASGGRSSSPAVPLNSTLIDLANKVNPETCDDAVKPLDSVWPYCRKNFSERRIQDDVMPSPKGTTQPPLVRYVTSPRRASDHVAPESRITGPGRVSPDITPQETQIPDVQLQCRVVKKWEDLSTLLIDIIPWCLLVNNTVDTVSIRDCETGVVIELPASQTVAPHKFQGKVQIGVTFPGTSSTSWSRTMDFPHKQQDKPASRGQQDSTTTPDHVTVSVAQVTSTGQPVAALWLMTSRTCYGVLVVSLEEQYCVINQTCQELRVYSVLTAGGTKVSTEQFTSERAMTIQDACDVSVPIRCWDVAATSALVLDEGGNAQLGEASPLLCLSLDQSKQSKQTRQTGNDEAGVHSREDEDLFSSGLETGHTVHKLDKQVEGHTNSKPGLDERCSKDVESVPAATSDISHQGDPVWSCPVFVSSGTKRSMVGATLSRDKTTLPLVLTTQTCGGIVHIIVAVDHSPRFILYNDCPFTLQFGQATPPQSPSYRKGSPEKIVVMEQMDPMYVVPEIGAFSSMHYEFPVVREWFKTSSEVQKFPDVHIQGLYNVTVSEISEGPEAAVQPGLTTEVPQGWSHGFDINIPGRFPVNLPGRGRVTVTVNKSRLSTVVRITPYNDEHEYDSLAPVPSFTTFDVEVVVTQLGFCLIDEVTHLRRPYEVVRATVDGLTLKHSLIPKKSSDSALPEFSMSIAGLQLDNQLEDDLYEFAVIVLPTVTLEGDHGSAPKRSPKEAGLLKPVFKLIARYEPGCEGSSAFLESVDLALEPLTVYIEDTFIYRLVTIAETFLPPVRKLDELTSVNDILILAQPSLNPTMVGLLRIHPITIHLTLHASIKLFIAMDDTPLYFGELQLSPVYTQSSALAQKIFYHYLSAAVFKVGWVLGSLELLGSPAGLIRNFTQGLSDFFYLPYDGLTRGPGAFVSGMSRGLSSFVRHCSAGALTSVTNLATSISRNLDRLCMDEQHSRLLEEHRCHRPTRLVTGLTQGLSGFGLSLLGAIAGVVDQPIQGIQRASDMRSAASGVIAGVGKGLLGVVTKPLGGAMELVSQTGQGILQGSGLSWLPTRRHRVGESLVTNVRNSHLKFVWKVLHFQSEPSLLLCLDAIIVTSPSGHGYSGSILLTPNTVYIVSTESDTIEQSLNIRDTEIRADERDNKTVVITTQQAGFSDDDVSEVPDAGDPERLKQFLRDAQNFARATAGIAADSPDAMYCSRFVAVVDPLLRQIVISQFKVAKARCIAETQL